MSEDGPFTCISIPSEDKIILNNSEKRFFKSRGQGMVMVRGWAQIEFQVNEDP